MDQVDFKYIINNNISDKVMQLLPSQHARIFWLSNFKCQTSVSADDLFQALRETYGFCQKDFTGALAGNQQVAAKNDFVYSITSNADEIQGCIRDAVDGQWDPILTQVKTYKGDSEGTNLIK